MASLLQGFEEVQLVKPVGKTVLTVTDSAIRFNKATAEVLGFPAYVKVLINDKTKQIAVTPTTAKADNAIKFSKPEGKQAASVSVKEATLIEAVKAYFTLPETPEGEIAYQSVNWYRLPRKQDRDFRCGQCHRWHHEAPRSQKGRLIRHIELDAFLPVGPRGRQP